MYEISNKEVPAIFDNYFTSNSDLHDDYNTHPRCCIHVHQVNTNRRDIIMRIQGGKVWNTKLLIDIDINNNIYVFLRCFKSHFLNLNQITFTQTN